MINECLLKKSSIIFFELRDTIIIYVELYVILLFTIYKNLIHMIGLLSNNLYELTPYGDKQVYFGGSGALAIYQLGYAKYLQENLKTDEYKYYGSSGGSIPCIIVASGKSVDEFFQKFIIHYGKNAKHIPFINTLDIFIETMQQFMEDDFYEKVNKNLGGISAMRLKLPLPTSIWFTDRCINNNNDLIDIVKASGTIPFMFNNFKAVAQVNNKYYIDSLFSLSIISELIKIIMFKLICFMGYFNRNYIFVSPWCNRYFSLIFFLPWYSEKYLRTLYDLGYTDAVENFKLKQFETAPKK